MSNIEAIKIFSHIYAIMTQPGSNVNDMRNEVAYYASDEYDIDFKEIYNNARIINNGGCINKCSGACKHAGINNCGDTLPGKS